MTENTVAKIPESMLNRWEEKEVNIMDTIHSIKLYNAPPWEVWDPKLEGCIMIKNSFTEWRYELFDKRVSMNIIKVRKAINGSYPLRNERWEIIKDSIGNAKRGFAFTEEYGRFTRNIDEVFFKKDNRVIRIPLWDLKTMLKTPTVDGAVNPFFKSAVSKDWEVYESSFLTDSYIIYWVFLDWKYAWEYFRLFLSNSSFGINWRDWAVCEPDVWTLNHSINLWVKLFNNYLLTVTLSSEREWNYFKANFSNTNLIFPKDNTKDFEFIEDLIREYKKTTFSSNVLWNVRLEKPTDGSYTAIALNKLWEYSSVKSVKEEQELEMVPSNFNPVSNQVSIWKPKVTKVDYNDWISIEDIPF